MCGIPFFRAGSGASTHCRDILVLLCSASQGFPHCLVASCLGYKRNTSRRCRVCRERGEREGGGGGERERGPFKREREPFKRGPFKREREPFKRGPFKRERGPFKRERGGGGGRSREREGRSREREGRSREREGGGGGGGRVKWRKKKERRKRDHTTSGRRKGGKGEAQG